jgi:hypothetical protein
MKPVSPSPVPAAPRLLVVTPTLGTSPYLPRCIETAAALNLDIVHVLSCPAPAVADIQARFPACRVIADAGRQGGMYEAINMGLRDQARETLWFTYINDDDELTPGFASMYRAFATGENESRIAFGDVRYIDAAGDSLGLMPTETEQRHFIPLLLSGITPLTQQGTLVGPRALKMVGAFDSTFRHLADLDYWVRCMVAGIPFCYHPIEVARFRLHAGQLSSNRAEVNDERVILMRRMEQIHVSSAQRLMSRLRYRVNNVPRYIERVKTVGWMSSEAMITSDAFSSR